MSETLASDAVRGARDLGLAQVIKFGVYLIGLVALSRLLSPEDFGVFAVATAFVGFAEYFRDFGLSVAAIRERDLPDAHRDALFWTNALLGVALTAIAASIAIPLSQIFSTPELAGVILGLSGVFLINGIGAQYRAGLTRERQYRRIAVADMTGAVVGLASAIIAALAGAGYWSLVVQALAVAAVGTTILLVFGAWRPGRPRRVSGMSRYYRFGADYAASQLIGYVGNNVDTVALGLWAGPRATGVYSRAFQLTIGALDQVKSPAVTVALPSLSLVRDDRQALMRFLLRGQLLLGYLTVPIAAVMFAAATPGVMLLLGAEWADTGAVVACLAVAAALQQLATVASWLFVTSGHAAQLRNYMIVSTTLKVIAVLLGV
jgi:PST family polysaccharide transporter